MELAEKGLIAVLAWEVDEDMNSFIALHQTRLGGSVMSEVAQDRSASSRTNATPAPAVSAPVSQYPSGTLHPGSMEREPTPSIHSIQSRHSFSSSRQHNNTGGGPSSSSGGGGGGGFLSKLKPKLNRARSSSQSNSYGNLDASSSQPTTASRYNTQQTSSDRDTLTQRDDETESLSARALSQDGSDYTPSTTSSAKKRHSILPGLMRRRSVSTKPAASSAAPIRQNL